MPRIPDSWLNAIVYLYRSESDARDGKRSGGTGCLLHVPNDSGPNPMYAVTNSHVIREGEAPVLRVNTRFGGSDVVALTPDDWIDHYRGADVSVAPLGLNSDHFLFDSISTILCLRSMDDDPRIGPGSETFFMGRLGEHEGRRRNLPVVRFGNVSMMPYEPVEDQRGTMQDSYLVEARSLGGFSGSPVFVDPSHFYQAGAGHSDFYMRATIRLLGIDWCHMRRMEPVLQDNGKPVPEGWKVSSNVGIMGVVPAWKILELLDEDELVEERMERLTAQQERVTVEPDALSKGSEFDDFRALTHRLLAVPKSELDEKRGENS